jgi:hypothetical protein
MSTETVDQLAQPPLAPFRVEQSNSASDLVWRVMDDAGQVVRRTASKGSAQAEADRMNSARGL